MSASHPTLPARCAGIVLLLLTSAVRGQEEEKPVVVPFDGTQAFRALLHQGDFQPLSSLDQVNEKPDLTILMVLGDTSVLNDPRLKGGLDGFLNRGGAVLIAANRFDPYVSGELIKGPATASAPGFFWGFPLSPFEEAVPDFFHSMDGKKRPLTRVVAKTPGEINSQQLALERDLRPLAVVQDQFNKGHCVGAFAQRGKGRLLVLADSAIFTNVVIIQRSTDNIDFAGNCVEWLANSSPRRDRVLFLENGSVQDRFDGPLTVPKFQLPPLDAFVPAANAFLDNVQRESYGFNSFVVPNEHQRSIWLAVVAFGLIALTAGLSFIWLSRARHRGDAQLPLLQQSLIRHSPGESLQTQRHRAQLTSGNLWEAARLLIRHELPQLASLRPPLVRTNNNARRKTLQKLVERLWRLAWGPVPEAVSVERYARLHPEVHNLKQALADGSVQLDVSS